jgi:drug/metabolite transporter (DMT)-like permease
LKRLNADLLLGFAGLIWGFGFVAQKDALSDHIGSFTFVAARFLISALFVLPFAVREGAFRRAMPAFPRRDWAKIAALCVAFAAAVITQQIGIETTTVTNAAFLTGLYIVLVPIAALILYRQKFSSLVLFACGLSLVGVGLLTGADPRHLLAGFNRGDMFVLLCAVFYAFQVPMMGHVVGAMKRPLTLSLLQYLVVGIAALLLAFCFETIDLQAIAAAWRPILYAGVLAGGVGYTLQAIAQQHTPSVDSAIIMSSETLFGAIGGAWLLHETMNVNGYVGCALILAAILLVETVPLLSGRKA